MVDFFQEMDSHVINPFYHYETDRAELLRNLNYTG